MTSLVRFLAKLYPAPWRAKYGAEFDQILADSKLGLRDAAGVLIAAIGMQFTKWGYGRFAAAGLSLGLAIALAVVLAIPEQFRSEAVVKVTASSEREAYDVMQRVTQEAITRSSLTKIMMTLKLYPDERRRMPLEDVILNMRRHVRTTRLATPGEFSISFEYPDRDAAQRATRHLSADVIDQSIRDLDLQMLHPEGIGVLQPVAVATLPLKSSHPPRGAIATSGIAAGMFAGLMCGYAIRRRRAIA